MFRYTTLFLALALFVAGCVAIPTEDEESAYTKSIVQDAIRYYERNGRDATVEHYSSEESRHGQWYVFIVDADGYTIASPNRETIGRGPEQRLDAKGYFYGDAFMSATEAGRWLSYVFRHPETGENARKRTWVVRHDGMFFASGFYQADEWITASDVTDRATLMEFVEGGRDYLEGITTLSEIARLRDVLRAEGRWKAGALYMTILTRNGYVILHGDDPTSEDKEIIAVNDEGGRPVVKELLDAAGRGGGVVDYRADGVERTAYAVEFTSGLTGMTLVLVGGFSQDLSSVPIEITPLPRPEVTAAEVVDRETLAIFVNAAAKAYRDAALTPGMRELGNTKNALRQEGGDWKAGSVYVFVISTEAYTLFHGGFPLRFEGLQFEDIDREDVNGVRYLRELLAAGEAGGGYVEYMFDNPAVEGDEETGSRKIAYATGYRLPGRDQVFVVVSGFYPDE
ncbi:MAG: cache domain-containing protein [Caldilineaceae bacterium]|nr:cache domain-containing protein [Caldilineaceae bacterium]